jgi:hypothetical protein
MTLMTVMTWLGAQGALILAGWRAKLALQALLLLTQGQMATA